MAQAIQQLKVVLLAMHMFCCGDQLLFSLSGLASALRASSASRFASDLARLS
jgi:hypothetical protein